MDSDKRAAVTSRGRSRKKVGGTLATSGQLCFTALVGPAEKVTASIGLSLFSCHLQHLCDGPGLSMTMAQKRKASKEGLPSPKRIHHPAVGNNGMFALKTTIPIHAYHSIDTVEEEPHSEDDFMSSGGSSIKSETVHDTPATPFSPASTKSAKYPSELKTHRCPFEACNKAFNRPARLQEHLRSHNNERLFRCTHDDCDKTFLRPSHLNHHVKSAHTAVRDYVCDRPGCDKSFVTGSRLRRHQAAHDGRDKYRCTEYPPCNETFRKHSTLQKHITTAHLNQKPFPCPHIDLNTGHKCQMAFDTAGHLRAHEGRIHSEKRFSCTECSQHLEDTMNIDDDNQSREVVFPSYALLQTHIRSVHPPRCPACPIVCATSRELRRHLEVAHGDVSLEERKAFPCTVPGCDRSFTKKGNLTVHIRTVHDGEKRFACGETDLSSSNKVTGWDGEGCGKRYGSKLALEEHIRTAHMGYMNAKAERRQRLGLSNERSKPTGLSAISALTGEGYAEETGRHIACFVESCAHRFHRDYDLWVHMSSKHGCSEDEIRDLFLQRALLAEDTQPSNDLVGIYGLEFDTEDPAYESFAIDGMASNNADAYDFGNSEFNADALMQGMDTSNDAMGAIDPMLAYDMMDE